MKFPLVKVGGTFVSVRTEDVLIFLAYLIWGVYLLLSGSLRTLLKDKLTQAQQDLERVRKEKESLVAELEWKQDRAEEKAMLDNSADAVRSVVGVLGY